MTACLSDAPGLQYASDCGHYPPSVRLIIARACCPVQCLTSYPYFSRAWQVLSPVQVARYLVGAYPMGPDMLSLMTCLARQGNEPSTNELLHAARPGTGAAGGSGATLGTGARLGTGAGATLGAASQSSGAISGAGARSGADSSFGASAGSGVVQCAAGDWRVALQQPLRVLHGAP